MSRIYIEGRSIKADKAKISRWVHKWRKRLHITDWTITIDLCTQQHGDCTYVATMDTNERYRTGNMFIYPHLWDLNFKEQERTIVHELVHLATNKVDILVGRLVCAELMNRDEILDSFETLTEWITNVIWDAYEK